MSAINAVIALPTRLWLGLGLVVLRDITATKGVIITRGR